MIGSDWPAPAPAYTLAEQRAWALYCEETAGSMDVRDFWSELSPNVQALYLAKVAA